MKVSIVEQPAPVIVSASDPTQIAVMYPPGNGSPPLAPTAVKTSSYSAAAFDLVPVDTTSRAVTVTLPSAPPDATRVAVKLVVVGGTNAVTIARGGTDVFNKAGGSTSLTLSLLNQGVIVQYTASSGIWYVVGDDLPLSQLDLRYAAIGGSQPSYLIVESGGTITATGCDAGLANFSGTDAPTVFQNAINALRGVGGSIWWKGKPVFATQQGTAVGGVSACIDLFPGIELRGQGPISQGTQSTSVITVTAAVNAPAIRVIVDPGNPTWPSFPVLRDFAVQGSGTGNTAQDACYIDGTNGNVLDVILDHFLVFDVGGNGLNSQSANAKVWADKCYFERCRQNGVRHAAGHLSVTKSYIQNNTLFGIDATSSDSLDAYFNKIWANAGGGAQLWSMTSGFNVAHNNFNNNGDNTHPVVILKSLTSLAKMGILEGNLMLDTRASASACQFFVNCTLGVFAEIVNNPMSGQKSGNKAINLTANASDSLVIKSNAGFNPLGSITNPLDTTNNRVGLGGSTATAVASTDYTIAHVDQYLVASGGTGVSITVKDPAGNTVESGLSSFAKVLPIGFKVNFGAFTVAPTVASFAN